MCDDLVDLDDDFWNHPSLLQYATISPKPTNTNHQNTNSHNTNSYASNPRKRTYDQYNNNHNHHSPNKRPRTHTNTNTNTLNNYYSHNNGNQNNDPNTYDIVPPECHHKLPMTRRITRKQGANHGKAFWCCAQSQQNQCKSFIWDTQHRRNSKNNKNAHTQQLKPQDTCVLSTELICIHPISLVEVHIHPFQQFFIDQIKKCNNAQWNPTQKTWVIPLEQHSHLIKYTRDICRKQKYIFKMNVIPSEIVKNVQKWKKSEINNIKSENECEFMDCIDGLPLKLRSSLYDFQKEGIRFAMHKNGRCLLADEMGLGKSIQAISIAYLYKHKWPLIVITPSSLTLTWKCEFLKWLSYRDMIRDCDINIIRKTNDKMLNYDTNTNMNKALCPITIISYGLAVRKQAEICDNKQLFGVIICDESHALKNYKTQRCKILLPLIKNIDHCLLLSGTPTNNRPSELWTQIDALRPGQFMSFRQYSIRYCEGQNSKFGWQANGAMHLKELHSVIKYKVMIRRTKKEVLTQLPDKIRTVISIEVDKSLEKKIKQKMARSEELKHEMSQMESESDNEWENEAANKMFDRKNKTMLELYSLSGMSKIAKIKEYIYDLYCSGEKFLVFGHHCAVLDSIQSCVEKKCQCGFIRIDGKTNTDKRQLLVDKFQSNKDVKIAILSITAAGTGLTLTSATTVVFAELYWGPTALLQCEDRAHRIGQKSTVNIVYLLGKGSLDDTMWPMIRKKMEVISKTLQGKHIEMEVEKYKDEYIKSFSPSKSLKGQSGCEERVNGSARKRQRKITDLLTFTPVKR